MQPSSGTRRNSIQWHGSSQWFFHTQKLIIWIKSKLLIVICIVISESDTTILGNMEIKSLWERNFLLNGFGFILSKFSQFILRGNWIGTLKQNCFRKSNHEHPSAQTTLRQCSWAYRSNQVRHYVDDCQRGSLAVDGMQKFYVLFGGSRIIEGLALDSYSNLTAKHDKILPSANKVSLM